MPLGQNLVISAVANPDAPTDALFRAALVGSYLPGTMGMLTSVLLVRNETPATSPPSATTQDATKTDEQVTLNGAVNAHDAITNVTFEFRIQPDGTPASVEATPSSIGGTSDVGVSADLDLIDLSPNTSYVFRVVATNSAGSTSGLEKTFDTPAVKPSATTDDASVSPTDQTVTLNGTVNAHNAETTVKFEYGTTSGALDKSKDVVSKVNGTTDQPVNVVLAPAELSPNTHYFFRVVATNSAGSTSGLEKT